MDENRNESGTETNEVKTGGFIQIVDEDEVSTFTMGNSKIFYRRIDQTVAQSIRKKWTTPDGINKKTGERRTKLNESEWYQDMVDYIITGWENIQHPTTKELVPATRANKNKLPPRVKEEIWDLAESEATDSDDAKEAEKKI